MIVQLNAQWLQSASQLFCSIHIRMRGKRKTARMVMGNHDTPGIDIDSPLYDGAQLQAHISLTALCYDIAVDDPQPAVQAEQKCRLFAIVTRILNC